MPDWPLDAYEKVKADAAMKWLGQPAPPVAENLRHAVPRGGIDSRGRHDVCDGGTRSRQGDCDGGRNSRMDVGSMTAMEARTLWLERKMGMLKRVMERETSLQRNLRSDYWRQEVRRDDPPLGRAHGLPEGDRASGQHGLPEGDRAFRQHGLPEGDRAFRQHGLPEGDRASRQHGLPEGDRAFSMDFLKEIGLSDDRDYLKEIGLSSSRDYLKEIGSVRGKQKVRKWINRDCLIHGRLRMRAQEKKRSGGWIIAHGRKGKPRGGWDLTMRTARTT